MGKLFGTDGIRGMANRYPITPDMGVKIGRAAALFFKNKTCRSKIIIGKDTRVSGDMMESALASGICSVGADALLAGILPTPGIAYLTSLKKADAGIVISASHNPYHDNGIKFFNSKGFKLSDQNEKIIENMIINETSNAENKAYDANGQQIGRICQIDHGRDTYADFLKNTTGQTAIPKGLKIVVDCSNGATYHVAPNLFADLGADVETIFTEPDGKNINAGCGSEYPAALCKKVVEIGANVGFAFDGDGDRLVAVDEKGTVLTGDQIIAICAKNMKDNALLKNNMVVTTIMSNMGLKQALKTMGIKHVTTHVGDRYVMEEMVSKGAVLGGEDSGHMIFLQHHTTGDGILSALRLIEAITDASKPLSELASVMTVFPQVQIGVKVKDKPEIEGVDEIVQAIKSVESSLKEKGRVLVRYSGTQPICRVMVEGPSLTYTQRLCKRLADVVKKQLGV